MTRVFDNIEELKAFEGKELGVSEWFDITQDDVNKFADVSLDRQWIHLDQAKAAEGPYGKTVAHGYMTLSLLPYFTKQVYQVAGVPMVVNYGSNKVRFPSPLLVGSKIRDRVTLVSVEEKPQGHQAVIEHEIEVEGKEKPTCVAQTVSLIFKAPEADSNE